MSRCVRLEGGVKNKGMRINGGAGRREVSSVRLENGTQVEG